MKINRILTSLITCLLVPSIAFGAWDSGKWDSTQASNQNIKSDLVPSQDDTYDIGSSAKEWKDLYIDGTGNIDTITDGTMTITGGVGSGFTSLSTADLTVSSDFDWSGGNTIYVPVTGSIADAITAATAGDTIQLGAGTYTISSTITVNKKLHIKGMGRGITMITASSDLSSMIEFTGGDCLISDLTVRRTGTLTNNRYFLYFTVSGNVFNVEFISLATGTSTRFLRVIYPSGTVNVENCSLTATGAVGSVSWLSSSANSSIANFINCRATSSGTTNGTYGGSLFIPETATGTTNIYGGNYAVTADVPGGVVCLFNGTVNVFGATLNGSGATNHDVNRIAGTLTLYSGTTLVNGKTSGTITYAGQDSVAVGGNIVYVPITGDIATAITNATAGDTLQLAAGTYTITSTLTVDKKLHIRGMGRGITTIANTVTLSHSPIFNITTEDGSVFSDFSATKSGTAGSDYLFRYSANASAYDIDFTDTSTGGAYPGFIQTNGAKTFNAYRCYYTASGEQPTHLFTNTATAGATINLYDCYGTTADGTQASFGNVLLYAGNATATINVYGGSYSSATNVASGVIWVSSGAVNIYEGTVINGSGASAFDVKRDAGTLTLYDCTLVNNTTSGTITYGGYDSLNKGGNVIQAPLGTDIDALIASSAVTAGDTLVLASGTYTVTDDIDVTKGINIVGQGIGKTTIACATDSKNIFDVTASNVRIADLSISGTGGTASGITFDGTASTVLTGAVVENVAITLSGSDLQNCILVKDFSGTIRNVVCNATSSNSQAFGLTFSQVTTTEAQCTWNVYGSEVVATGATTNIANGIRNVAGGGSASGYTVNLYDTKAVATGASATAKDALLCTAGAGVTTAYGCTFKGDNTDITQSGTATCTVYDCTLVNNTTSGTITYGGTTTIGTTTTGGTGSAGTGNQYVELSIGGVKYKLLHDGTV